MQDRAKEHDIHWRFYLLYNLLALLLVERKNGILKQQIKLPIGKTALAGWTKVLPRALIHLNDLNDQPVGHDDPDARLGTPAEIPHVVKAKYWWDTDTALPLTLHQSALLLSPHHSWERPYLLEFTVGCSTGMGELLCTPE